MDIEYSAHEEYILSLALSADARYAIQNYIDQKHQLEQVVNAMRDSATVFGADFVDVFEAEQQDVLVALKGVVIEAFKANKPLYMIASTEEGYNKAVLCLHDAWNKKMTLTSVLRFGLGCIWRAMEQMRVAGDMGLSYSFGTDITIDSGDAYISEASTGWIHSNRVYDVLKDGEFTHE